MKILAINCIPDLTYFKDKIDFQVDYKITDKVFPYFIARAKNTALGTPDMYSPDPTTYISQFKGYDFIIVCYDPAKYPSTFASTGGYTNSVPVNNSIWCTVRKDSYTNKYITHELMHCLVYYLNVIKGLNKSNSTMAWDYMDSDKQGRPYHLNDFPDNPDSNFSQTWEQIKKNINLLKPMYKYFKDSEIVGLKPELVKLLDQARDVAGVPFKITSGFRTPEQNKKVGGVQDSAHETGLAVDILVKDSVSGGKILLALAQVGIKRFGFYNDGHIHCDIDYSKPNPCYWIK